MQHRLICDRFGRSVLSQSKECIYKNFPGGFAPRPPQSTLSFEVSAEPDARFFKSFIYFIFLNPSDHDSPLKIPLQSGAC